jgi:DNA topoisomerase II
MSSAKISKLQSIASGGGKKNGKFSDGESDNDTDDEKQEKMIEYKTGEVSYQKMDPRSHVLHRPDMYIGNISRIKSSGRIWVKGKDRFECREAYFTDGLLRILMEAISNAIDNIWRSKERKIEPKFIKITIDKESGWISVWNDGLPISLGKFVDSKTGKASGKYIPEEIFGELLIGSNYDDDEKRKTSGTNGLGSKAVARDTKIFMWDGSIKMAQNVKVGDRLIGDDGNDRLVTDVFTGKNKLWEIKQAYGQAYTVSSGHILTLHMPDHGVVFWNKSKGAWSVLWWDSKSKMIRADCFRGDRIASWNCPMCKKDLTSDRNRHYKRVHKDVEIPKIQRASPTVVPPDTEKIRSARIKAEKFAASLPQDNTIDITVEDYLALNKTTQHRLAGLRGKCINWSAQQVDLDPYILGMWLGDGFQDGYAFSSEDPELINSWLIWARKNDAEILHTRKDVWQIRRKNGVVSSGVGIVGRMDTSNLDCSACKEKLSIVCSSDAELKILGKKRVIELEASQDGTPHKDHPLKKHLRRYNLVENKRIPLQYIQNSREIRLKVLAGLIDTDGTVCRDGTRIIITQGLNHSDLADDIVLLVRSLGFACFAITKKTQWTYNGELKRGLARVINISGTGVEDIPTLLPRKKCAPPKEKNMAKTSGYITITEKPEGEWVGITVNGNHRFCLNDMTVIHNCLNIYSRVFELELFNPAYNAIYRQKWTENMSNKEDIMWDRNKDNFPTSDGKNGYTQVRFKPDYARFGYSSGLDEDMISVLEKSIHDYALIAGMNGVETIYNNKKIAISSLKDYVNLYYDEEPQELLQLKSEDCTVIVAPKADPLFKGDLMHVAFINGIITAKGGVHVDDWDEAIFRPIVQKINGVTKKKKEGAKKPAAKKKVVEKKRPTIDISHVRKYFSLFIVAEVDNPRFTGQNKEIFNSPPIHTKVKNTDISKLMKWDFVERIEDSIKLKEFASLKDAGKKKRNSLNIPQLEDANFAGDPKRGKECILIFCEGDSAASYAAIGMQFELDGVTGQNSIGIFCLRGKILNVRNAGITKILKNKEVIGAIKALGLEYGVDYSELKNRNKLRYGKVYVVSDGDNDGLHITGLMVNFIHTLFPSLLIANDFFHFLRIPAVKINMKQEQLSFLFYYTSQQYLLNHMVPKKAIRYFKGLGTFKPKDIAEDFGRYPVALIMTDKAEELLPKVFGKDDSHFRKEWLLKHQDKIMERKTPDFEVEQLPIEQFLEDEMRVYSIESCLRGIPRAIDGLKESTCKVLNTAIDEPLNYNSEEMKVVQLAGAVAKEMGYHHGEQNIPSIIIKLAQSFPGSNNIPLFYASGHFGSRQGGKKDLAVGDDASAGRYIFTKLEMLTRYIFRPEDDEYLPNNVQDGKIVEKKYYMPIIPMVLVNGASGIGTAHSSTVPQYNPFELMDWIDTWLEKHGQIKTESKGLTFYETPPLVPYYRGFTGKIEVDGPKITIKGVMEQTNKNEWTITELPLGRLNVSIKKYRTKLEKFKDEKKIKSFTSQKHDLNKPFFTITADPDGIIPNLQNMKLIDTISTTNMVLFNEESKLMKFESVEAILEYYCRRRYDFYTIRMNGMLQALRLDLKWASNKIRFIRLVHEKTLEIRDRDEQELDSEMVSLKFDKQPKAKRGKQQTKASPDQDDDFNDEKESKSPESFDYLLGMKIACLNIASKAYKELERKKLAIEAQIKDIESTTVEALWRREMKELKEAHAKWEKRMADDAKVPKRGKKGKSKKSKREVESD